MEDGNDASFVSLLAPLGELSIHVPTADGGSAEASLKDLLHAGIVRCATGADEWTMHVTRDEDRLSIVWDDVPPAAGPADA